MQNTVYRQYTTGFPGDIIRDGPFRAKPARISSASIGPDPAQSTNRVSRAFGAVSEVLPTGNTYSAMEMTVAVGGPIFFGILCHPKHYALYGSVALGSLSASMDLPVGAEGEFADMATGLVVELHNETAANKSVNYGDGVAYVPSNITVGNNALALPYGALISVPAGGPAPTGMILIPNARVINPESLGASAAGALVSGYTLIQLTQ